jgi:iron complex transport system permease protein
MTRGLVAIGLCLLVILAAPFVGESLAGTHGSFIFVELRLPRTLMAVVAGGTLSLVGATYQALFGNVLASENTVGSLAGATLGAVAALILGAGRGVGGLPAVTVCAFAGAVLVTIPLMSLAASGRASIGSVLLAGIATSTMATAISMGLQYTADATSVFTAARWTLGSLQQLGYAGVAVVATVAVPSAAVLLSQIRALEALAAGEERAHAQGVSLARVRTVCLASSALGVAAVVAWCGPIAFVGLIVPNLVRVLFGATRRRLLPYSILFGAAFLVACDALARAVWPGHELPVGVVTAALGAPALVWLIAHRSPFAA